MKVYVNELPKCCSECPCGSGYWCNLLECVKNEDEYSKEHPLDCPLQSLADHDKQTIKDFTQSVKGALIDKIKLMKNEEHCYLQKVVKWEDIIYILNKLSV